jgi:hypothetical protein
MAQIAGFVKSDATNPAASGIGLGMAGSAN